MGTDKALLVVDGETLAARSARVLAAVCSPAVEVGPGRSGLRCIAEPEPGGGPLAALLAAVSEFPDTAVVLLACDMPFVDEPALRTIVEHPDPGSVVPVVHGDAQYACARWSAAAIASAREAFRGGERSLRALLGAGDATRIPFDARTLADVDTPADVERLGLS
jgi:molybdopterin-guanine dinucleotide biosynthesis protein A